MNLRTTILFLFCCLLYGGSIAQTNFCNSSKIIPLECRKKVFGSNKNSGNTLVHADYKNCVSGVNASTNPYNGNDVIYEVNVDDSNLRLLLDGLTADLDLFLFQDCSAQRSCFYKSLNSGNNEEVIQIPLANGTYYVVVDGYDVSQKSDFALTAICRQGDDPDDTPECDPLACTDAYTIGCDQAVTSTTVGKPSRLNKECNYGTHCANGYADYTAGDRVFKVQVPSGKDKLKITLSNFQKNLDLFVFKNACQLNQCIAASQRTSGSSEYISIDNPSGYYYIVVDGNSDFDESSFKLTVECEEEQSFDCSSAQQLYCNKTYEGSNRYEYNNLNHADYGSCANSLSSYYYPYNGKDLLYKIYVEEDQSLNIYMTDLHANLDMFLYRFCAGYVGGLNGCVDRSVKDGNWAEHISADNLQEGYYYLVIDGRDAYQESSFKLKIDCSEPCDPEVKEDCNDLSFNYVGTGNDLLYQFSVPSSHPLGKWTVTNSNNNSVQTFEGRRSIRFDFSRSGKYKICYTYKDYNGCEYQCCKTVFIKAPNDCENITIEDQGDKIALSVLSSDYRAISWRNLTSGTSLGGDQVLLINAPRPGRCFIIEALVYDKIQNAYRYCRVNVCKEDNTNDLQWLDDLIADLGVCCEENDDIQIEVQKGKLSGETVYLVPDCATADGFLTIYDEDGDIICQAGGFAGFVCNELDDIRDLTTIFSCGDDNNDDCITISDQSIDCDENGVVSYTFKATNQTGGADVLLEFGVDSESEVKFENCSIRNTFLLEGDETMITLKLKNCGDEDLEDGTPVTISVKIKDGDRAVCEGEQVTIGVSECESCKGDPLEDVFCTEEFDPVCGCDGVTYSNACNAAVAGVNVWVKGACDAAEGEGADLSLDVSTDAARFNIFEKVPFTVTVTNDGPETANNVIVSIPLPVATAYSLSTPSVGSYRVVAETWEVGDLAAGESASIEFVVFTLSANADLTLYAQVSASDTSDPDSTPGNGSADDINEDDEDSATVTPANAANLANGSSNSFGLENFPNPFTQATTIQFVLEEQSNATLSVFDINGKNIFEVSRTFDKGLNQVAFNNTNQLPEGMYFYRLQTERITMTKSMILTK